jgi:hypothetical protein
MRVTSAMKAGARCAALSTVRARVTAVAASDMIAFMSFVARGVVVTTWRGSVPSLKPNCSMSQARLPRFQRPSSSHQAASN